MDVKSYIFFNGNASEAVDAYSKIFGSEPSMLMRMADAPPDMDIPKDRKDWIMHCELPIGEGSIYLSDDFTSNVDDPTSNNRAMEGCSVMVNCKTASEGKQVFDGLAKGGEIRMEWVPTFWSAGFGTLTDRFGIRWMVGCDEEPASA